MTGGMMFKGTPGPWRVFNGTDVFPDDDDTEGSRHIADFSMSENISVDEQRANANLGAAATALLNIAQRSLKYAMTAAAYRKERGWDTSTNEDKFVEDARAAIAKALGETK